MAPWQLGCTFLLWLGRENGGKGRIYNFFRGLDGRNKYSCAWSDDRGETWKTGNAFIQVPGQLPHRPRVKYASNGANTVHRFYTDGHPNEVLKGCYPLSPRPAVWQMKITPGQLANRGAKEDPISVDLPAPFLPTMAIRPSPRASKLMPILLGKASVIPRILR